MKESEVFFKQISNQTFTEPALYDSMLRDALVLSKSRKFFETSLSFLVWMLKNRITVPNTFEKMKRNHARWHVFGFHFMTSSGWRSNCVSVFHFVDLNIFWIQSASVIMFLIKTFWDHDISWRFRKICSSDLLNRV